jgi:translation initiation factor IF-2
MSKVRINDLARELEVKSRPILDALEAIGVTGKTHSSSIEADQAERVREYFRNGGRNSTASRQPADNKPKFDLSKVSKPGDALKAILERKQAEAAAKAAPPRPTAVVAPPS